MASSIATLVDRGRPDRPTVRTALRWIVIVGGVASLLAVATLGLTTTSLFRVHTIRVEGLSHLSHRHVLRLAGIEPGENAIWLDEGAVEARIAADPWVAQVDVRIDLPWTVIVTVGERSPVATVGLGTGSALVAADGTILGPGPTRRLPSIEVPPSAVGRLGIGSAGALRGSALALAALDEEARALVRRVVLTPSNDLQLYLSDGTRVEYGLPGAYEAKARSLAEVLRWIGESGERVQTISVVAPSAPAVTPPG